MRRSILVRSTVYQEGPKNPLKGISLKPLVSALNAQFGVGAGGKCGQRKFSEHLDRACVLRALSNGMENPTLFAWRPDLVRDKSRTTQAWTCIAVHKALDKTWKVFAPNTWAKACGAGTDVLDDAPGAVCSVACLEWYVRIEETPVWIMAIVQAGLLLKYLLQKRLRDGLTVVENT